jgi:hypothetical protein
MTTPKPETETPSGETVVYLRERILSRYDARDRELIENVMKNHPALTLAKTIEHLEAAGGL